ncbi:coniferyl aldehyde dehydrogenase [Planctomicrobium sp. SH527]|uniref:coniferyl aldehyde dehydrogenase n=1 Tax=Planctomicrobium sp. SH527 TaxID=3448123 RepID=UPI003F5B2482
MLMPTQELHPPGTVEFRLKSRSDQDTIQFLDGVFALQRRHFEIHPNEPLAVRLDRLNRLEEMIEVNESEIIEAIDADFHGRSQHETKLAELFVVRSSIRHARRHLSRWMQSRRVPTGLQFLPGRNRLLRQPLGLVGIIAPWNYPLQLSISPAIAALAAGNRVLIKPSELAPRFADLLALLVERHFGPEEMSVVTGGKEVGQAFASLRFDHLVFTGSTTVGRKVAKVAAANLTPVTLELGGKSPVIIDESADLGLAASRIAFGKWMNAGQTCVAPDYLLVPAGKAAAVAHAIEAAITSLYPTLRDNPDYTSLINAESRERLVDLIEEARQSGAQIIEVNPAREVFDQSTTKLPPTIVIGAAPENRLLTEEIFGPILPIVEYETIDEALAWIRRGERPLALYWFGNNAAERDRILKETISGGVTINDCLWHLAQEEQPFGGVGESGMGAYHGEWGFRTFSKEKPVFIQSSLSGSWLLYPPYGKTFDLLLKVLKRIT